MATLHPVNGTAALEVDGEGVRIAGLLIEAGAFASDVLFRIGTDHEEGDPLNPTVVSDVFIRSGRFYKDDEEYVKADMGLLIEQSFAIVDNYWLWRGHYDAQGNVYSE